jgi:hypothetical protein
LLGALDLAFDLVGGKIDIGTNQIRAKFVVDLARVINQRWFVTDSENARTCSGANQSGGFICSIRKPMKRSCVPNGARRIRRC